MERSTKLNIPVDDFSITVRRSKTGTTEDESTSVEIDFIFNNDTVVTLGFDDDGPTSRFRSFFNALGTAEPPLNPYGSRDPAIPD